MARGATGLFSGIIWLITTREEHSMRVRLVALLLTLCLGAAALAGELTAEPFAETPSPGARDLLSPRAVTVDAGTGRLYILDAGLGRVLVLAPDGHPVTAWPLPESVSSSMPADPLLPAPVLAAAGDTVYLLHIDRAARQVELFVVDGPGQGREVTLPDGAGYGAVTLDAAGHVLVAYLRAAAKMTLTVAAEGADGTFTTLGTLDNPCDEQAKGLALTGLALAPDGRVAIGLAQTGDAAYSFIRSWLVSGTLKGDTFTGKTTHRFGLLDLHGKPLDRYRAMVALAGREGFPVKPCVPLFTALVLTPGGSIISGGHALDPFLRIYSVDGKLQVSRPRTASGGQTLALITDKEGGFRLLATVPARHCVEEHTLDGRVVDMYGRPFSFALERPQALAASTTGVYCLNRGEDGLSLLRFARDGRFQWTRPVTAPRGMEKADAFLAASPNGDRVFLGWRQTDTVGLGAVDVIMEDGTPGMPLWAEAWTKPAFTTAAICPTPLVLGANDRLYVLREMKDGTRLQAFAPSGALLQPFPTVIQGLFAVSADGSLGWARADADGLTINRYTREGAERGWKRVPRQADADATLVSAQAKGLWGWCSATKSLLQFDDEFTVVDEKTLLTPDGDRIERPAALAGDRDGRLYLALTGRIVLLKIP
jgi:hypothetical protein